MRRTLPLFRRHWCVLSLLTLLAAPYFTFAALPTKAGDRAALVGKPAALVVQPAAITLTGPRATQQLVVTGKYADGTVRDLTPFAALRVQQADIAALADGFLTPRKNGATALVVEAGGQLVR